MKERAFNAAPDEVRHMLTNETGQVWRPMVYEFGDVNTIPEDCMNGFLGLQDGNAVFEIQQTVDSSSELRVKCPFQDGMKLYVREAIDGLCGCDAEYVADESRLVDSHPDGWDVWRDGRALPLRTISSATMPRWASRITLEVTGVRAARVHNISDADVRAAGITPAEVDRWREWLHPGDVHGHAFGVRWNSRYAKRGFGWKTNPYAWAWEYKRVKP